MTTQEAINEAVEQLNYCQDGYYGDCAEQTLKELLLFLYNNGTIPIDVSHYVDVKLTKEFSLFKDKK